jgi:hypothetical protein
MQLEARAPAHRGLAALGGLGEDAVLTDAGRMANLQRGGVDEPDPGAIAHLLVQIGEQGNHHRWHQLHEALVTHQGRYLAA